MPLEPATLAMLRSTMTIDFTTIGRNSGQPRTIEIWWFHVDGRFIITGTPGTRDWLANIRANPAVVISVGDGEFSGIAVEIDDVMFRRTVFTHPDVGWYETQAELDALIAGSPMVEVVLHNATTDR
jgi:deazaflavin-dependent oxidoreductase (nitroreductase family)